MSLQIPFPSERLEARRLYRESLTSWSPDLAVAQMERHLGDPLEWMTKHTDPAVFLL